MLVIFQTYSPLHKMFVLFKNSTMVKGVFAEHLIIRNLFLVNWLDFC
jgi:hypothetical protein